MAISKATNVWAVKKEARTVRLGPTGGTPGWVGDVGEEFPALLVGAAPETRGRARARQQALRAKTLATSGGAASSSSGTGAAGGSSAAACPAGADDWQMAESEVEIDAVEGTSASGPNLGTSQSELAFLKRLRTAGEILEEIEDADAPEGPEFDEGPFTASATRLRSPGQSRTREPRCIRDTSGSPWSLSSGRMSGSWG
jgi:hypothetical protein